MVATELTEHQFSNVVTDFRDFWGDVYVGCKKRHLDGQMDKWTDVLDIQQKKISAASELSVYEKAFVKSDKTDAILVVEGKKLHVNKAFLSYHSDYFVTLFNSEFKEKTMEEIEIMDVKFEDFATLLSLVHGTPLAITSSNTNNLLILAERFFLRAAKLHVERFILSSNWFNRRQQLVWADKYNLEDLLKHAIELYNNRAAFQDFYKYPNTDISDELRLKLFDNFFLKFADKLG